MKGHSILFIATLWMLVICNVPASVFYVDVNSANATPPYSDWSIAATNIQDAIDAATDGDLVLVTNGIYNAGSRTVGSYGTSRIAITKPIEVASINGPSETIITGYGRCAYLTNGASLVGFTLTGGNAYSQQGGGGALCESTDAFITNCIIDGCSAAGGGGGGVRSGTLKDCKISNNYHEVYGAGAYLSTLINCTLTGNSNIFYGGGAANCLLVHCVLSNNWSSFGGGAFSCTLSDCLIISNRPTLASAYYHGAYGGGVCGGALTNCTLVGNSATYGGGAYSGVTLPGNYYMASNPIVFYQCIISNNTAGYGGGVWEMLTQGFDLTNCILTDCVITGNTATNVGGGIVGGMLGQCLISSNRVTSAYTTIYNEGITGIGGGAEETSLNNCALIGNTAAGGSALDVSEYYTDHYIRCSSTNCTIVGNISTNGAAVYSVIYGYLNNCILYSNVAYAGGNVWVLSNYGPLPLSMTYCCTVPLPSGAGNFTNDPTFVNPAAGDLHLQSNSPCINAGNNNYVGSTTDLDGNPRIAGGTVDVGCYEYQTPASVLSYVWAQQYGLATDGSADFVDSDGDGMSNWAEWKAGTVPTNAVSVLQLLPPVNNGSGLMVTWQSVSGIAYYLQNTTNLGAQPVFMCIQSNIVGQAGTTSYTDTTATNDGPYFYRVGVQ